MKAWIIHWKSHDKHGTVVGRCFTDMPKNPGDLVEIMSIVSQAIRHFMEDRKVDCDEIDFITFRPRSYDPLIPIAEDLPKVMTPWGMMTSLEFEFTPYPDAERN